VSTVPQWRKMLSKTLAKDFLFLAPARVGEEAGDRVYQIKN
jgi:hypothetical protein